MEVEQKVGTWSSNFSHKNLQQLGLILSILAPQVMLFFGFGLPRLQDNLKLVDNDRTKSLKAGIPFDQRRPSRSNSIHFKGKKHQAAFCSVPRLYNRLYSGIMNVVRTPGSMRERERGYLMLLIMLRAKAAVLKDMDTVGKEARLRGFKSAKAITLVLEPFTMENDLLTPTYKIKRPQARAYFTKEIADMYAELS